MKTIELTQGYSALVDDEDYEWLNQYKWCVGLLTSGLIAMRRRKGKTVYMHRVIMNAQKSQVVDHANRDRLDNRRSNLRFATGSQNSANRGPQLNNTSGYKGVSKGSYRGWQADIRLNYRSIYIGTFCRPELAALAYDVMSEYYYGEFAYQNFPQQQEGTNS